MCFPAVLGESFFTLSIRKLLFIQKRHRVVTFDNFLAPGEAKALISTVKKWERSTDSGLTNEFGETGRILSSGRTSSNR
jgi:hypothetical protein